MTDSIRSADNDLNVSVSGVVGYVDQIEQRLRVVDSQLIELKAQTGEGPTAGLVVGIEQAVADVRGVNTRLGNALPGAVPAEAPVAAPEPAPEAAAPVAAPAPEPIPETPAPAGDQMTSTQTMGTDKSEGPVA